MHTATHAGGLRGERPLAVPVFTGVKGQQTHACRKQLEECDGWRRRRGAGIEKVPSAGGVLSVLSGLRESGGGSGGQVGGRSNWCHIISGKRSKTMSPF